jgi:hypothetical protein
MYRSLSHCNIDLGDLGPEFKLTIVDDKNGWYINKKHCAEYALESVKDHIKFTFIEILRCHPYRNTTNCIIKFNNITIFNEEQGRLGSFYELVGTSWLCTGPLKDRVFEIINEVINKIELAEKQKAHEIEHQRVEKCKALNDEYLKLRSCNND